MVGKRPIVCGWLCWSLAKGARMQSDWKSFVDGSSMINDNEFLGLSFLLGNFTLKMNCILP